MTYGLIPMHRVFLIKELIHFRDIADLSQYFVMINCKDEEEPQGKVFCPDGKYYPRILFMSMWIISIDGMHKYIILYAYSLYIFYRSKRGSFDWCNEQIWSRQILVLLLYFRIRFYFNFNFFFWCQMILSILFCYHVSYFHYCYEYFINF